MTPSHKARSCLWKSFVHFPEQQITESRPIYTQTIYTTHTTPHMCHCLRPDNHPLPYAFTSVRARSITRSLWKPKMMVSQLTLGLWTSRAASWLACLLSSHPTPWMWPRNATKSQGCSVLSSEYGQSCARGGMNGQMFARRAVCSWLGQDASIT
jgi:hypothetical protein